MTETKPPKDMAMKCYCGSSTKYHYDRKMFKCDKIGEWMFFYYNHSCIKFRKDKEEAVVVEINGKM